MLDSTVCLTVVSGFHYAWVASQRIGMVPESNPASMRNSRQG
jgi:hypothetical protein